MLTGLAAAVAFKARLFNIGAEGQLYVGALAAVAVGGLHGGTGFDCTGHGLSALNDEFSNSLEHLERNLLRGWSRPGKPIEPILRDFINEHSLRRTRRCSEKWYAKCAEYLNLCFVPEGLRVNQQAIHIENGCPSGRRHVV